MQHIGNWQKDKGTFLSSAVSSRLDCSKRFTSLLYITSIASLLESVSVGICAIHRNTHARSPKQSLLDKTVSKEAFDLNFPEKYTLNKSNVNTHRSSIDLLKYGMLCYRQENICNLK